MSPPLRVLCHAAAIQLGSAAWWEDSRATLMYVCVCVRLCAYIEQSLTLLSQDDG